MSVVHEKRWKNWAALGMGCALVVLAVGGSELVLRVVRPGPRPIEEFRTVAYQERDDVLGWRPSASVQTRTGKRLAGTTIYDVTYTFDQYRRRVVPGDAPAAQRRFLLFFGCSHTFGEGLEDDETLPYDVSRLLPGTHVYNYGFRGYGPQHMLARLETSNLRAEVAEPAGAAVLVFPAFLIDRLVGGSSTMTWVADLPYYRMQDGEPIRDGFFQTTLPTYSWLMRTIGDSRLMQSLHIAWPPRTFPAHLALACAVIAKAQRLLDQQLGPTPLVVVLHPMGRSLDLASCLDPLGIPLLDLHDLFPAAEREAMRIPIDGHTNARGNRLLAERLVPDLERIVPAIAP